METLRLPLFSLPHDRALSAASPTDTFGNRKARCFLATGPIFSHKPTMSADVPSAPGAKPTRRYSAFISYRHADNTQEGRRWAEWLHRALERYTVPPDLIGTPTLRGEPIRDSLYPIFRDEDELPANADLATGIRAALEVSDHLIVLCSPRSAVSPWVRKEVREFKELGRSDRILVEAYSSFHRHA